MNRRTMLATLLLAPYAFSKPPELADALLIGDSLAGQLGPRLAKEAMARGKKFLYNFRAGSSTRQWSRGKWLERVLRPHPTRVVLICLGTNCTKAERPGLVKDIHTLLKQAGTTPVLWLMPPPQKPSRRYLVDAMEHITMDLTNPVLRLHVLHPGALPMESDHIHPTDAGHRQWAALLSKELWG